MPTDGAFQRGRPVVRSELVKGLRALGVRPGGVLMVHTRMSAIGWAVGGSQTVVEALLAAVGPGGTLMAYAGWEDDPWHLAEWPPEWQRAYRAELPPFDPELSEADHEMGRLPERIRTWPGEKVTWREVRDYDTSSRGAFPYERVIPRGDEAFAVIGRLALAAGAGVTGQVGDAESHLFAARPLVIFAAGWLRQHFDGGAADTPSV